MTNKLHTQYPAQYQDELDRLFNVWSNVDRVADNAGYEDEFKNDDADNALAFYQERKREIDFQVETPHAAKAHAVYLEVEQIKREQRWVKKGQDRWNDMVAYDNTINDFLAGTGRV